MVFIFESFFICLRSWLFDFDFFLSYLIWYHFIFKAFVGLGFASNLDNWKREQVNNNRSGNVFTITTSATRQKPCDGGLVLSAHCPPFAGKWKDFNWWPTEVFFVFLSFSLLTKNNISPNSAAARARGWNLRFLANLRFLLKGEKTKRQKRPQWATQWLSR